MKNLYLFLLISFSISVHAQNDEYQFENLNGEMLETTNLFGETTPKSPFHNNEERTIIRNTNLWLLDSTYSYQGEENDWVLSQRIKTLTRDTFANTLNQIFHSYIDSISLFQKQTLVSNTYHDSITPSSRQVQRWDEVAEDWFDLGHSLYNEFGNIYYDECEDPFANSPFEIHKTIHEYNADQLLILQTHYDLDSMNQWILKTQKMYSYNSLNLIEFKSRWDEGTPTDSTYYIYNSDGLLELSILLNWDTLSTEWVPKYKYDFSYNADGNISQRIHEYWNSTQNTWIDYHIDNYTYDPAIYFNSIETKTYTTSQGWHNSRRSDYQYDENGNPLLYQSYLGEGTNGWKNSTMRTYTYDENGNEIQYVILSWNNNLQLWKNNSRRDSYYSQNSVVTNTNNISTTKISISPNPSTGYFSIVLERNDELLGKSFQVIDQFGRKVLESSVTSSSFELDLSFAPAGIYHLLLSSGESLSLVKQ